jgi:hypothetical protein
LNVSIISISSFWTRIRRPTAQIGIPEKIAGVFIVKEDTEAGFGYELVGIFA